MSSPRPGGLARKSAPRSSLFALLAKFIADQPKLGDKYENADRFFAAMETFLGNEKAKEAIRELWRDRQLDFYEERIGRKVEEYVGDEGEQQIMRLLYGFADEAGVVKTIRRQIRGVEVLTAGVSFSGFCARPGMQLALERAIEVISAALHCLGPRLSKKLDTLRVIDIQLLSYKLRKYGVCVARKELWAVRDVAFPELKKVLGKQNKT